LQQKQCDFKPHIAHSKLIDHDDYASPIVVDLKQKGLVLHEIP
jgi:hypothetical protein